MKFLPHLLPSEIKVVYTPSADLKCIETLLLLPEFDPDKPLQAFKEPNYNDDSTIFAPRGATCVKVNFYEDRDWRTLSYDIVPQSRYSWFNAPEHAEQYRIKLIKEKYKI